MLEIGAGVSQLSAISLDSESVDAVMNLEHMFVSFGYYVPSSAEFVSFVVLSAPVSAAA